MCIKEQDTICAALTVSLGYLLFSNQSVSCLETNCEKRIKKQRRAFIKTR